MSRSIGARSFTTVSPIMIWPEVMVSSPAIMRSVVVLPQPEGPTKTMNSLSRTSRFTSFTAWTSSYLFQAADDDLGHGALPLHGAGHPGDVVLDEERVYQRHRDGPEQR